jgi:hypothetical protein
MMASALFAFTIALCMLSFAHAQTSCLVVFNGTPPQATISAPFGCVSLTNGLDAVSLSQNTDLSGASIDLGNGVFSLGISGFQLLLSNAVLLSAVIFPPMVSPNGPLPAAFDLRMGGSVQVRNVTVFTSNCSVVSQWTSFINNGSSSNATSLIISALSLAQANIANMTLTCNRSLILKQVIGCPLGCNGNSSALPSAFVRSGDELISDLPLLTSLYSPFSITTLADIDLTNKPSWVIAQGSNATINGGGRGMNLAGNPTLASLSTSPRTTLSLVNLTIINGCVQFDSRLQPNQLLAISSTLPGVVYSNTSKMSPFPFRGLLVQGSTLVVSSDEIQALTYWYVALLSPRAFSSSPLLSPMSSQLQIQNLSLQSPPNRSTLQVTLMLGPGLQYNNVTITSLPPQGLNPVLQTQYICNTPNVTRLDPSVSDTLMIHLL